VQVLQNMKNNQAAAASQSSNTVNATSTSLAQVSSSNSSQTTPSNISLPAEGTISEKDKQFSLTTNDSLMNNASSSKSSIEKQSNLETVKINKPLNSTSENLANNIKTIQPATNQNNDNLASTLDNTTTTKNVNSISSTSLVANPVPLPTLNYSQVVSKPQASVQTSTATSNSVAQLPVYTNQTVNTSMTQSRSNQQPTHLPKGAIPTTRLINTDKPQTTNNQTQQQIQQQSLNNQPITQPTHQHSTTILDIRASNDYNDENSNISNQQDQDKSQNQGQIGD
jgi:hypothetical protein